MNAHPGFDGGLAATFEAAPEAIFVHDIETTEILAANPAATELTGYDRDDLRGMEVTDISVVDPAYSRERVVEVLEQAAETGEGTVQWKIERADGGVDQVSVYLRPATIDGTEYVVAYVRSPSRREAELTEHQSQMETVLANLPVILFTLDQDGTFTRSRGKGLDVLGLDQGEVVGQSVFDVYAETPEITDGVRQALAGKEVQTTAELADRTFEAWFTPVKEDGTVTDIIGIARDITELQERKRELEDSEAVLRQLTETSDDVFWLFNEDFTELQFVNGAYEDVWGQSIDELQEDATKFLEGVHPEDRERVQGAVQRLVQGESTDLEYRVNPTEDFGRWVWVHGNPILDADGNVDRIAGFVRDITERKAHQQQLESLSEAIKQLSYGQSMDEVARRIVEIVDDVLGHSLSLLCRYDADGDVLVPWRGTDRAFEVVEPGGADGPNPCTDGTVEMEAFDSGSMTTVENYRELDNTSYPDAELGTVLMFPLAEYGLLTVGSTSVDGFEKTERNLLSILAGNAEAAFHRASREQALEEYKDELERSNQNLQEFAYIASHDLQEPLRMVSSYVDLIEQEYRDELDEEAQEYIEFAVDGATRMKAMIDSLLEYSRVHTTGSEFEPVDLNEVFEETVKNLEIVIEDADAEVTAEELPTVEVDREQIGQVLQNLVSNAIEHGGTDTPTVDVTVTERDDAFEFVVSDDGKGIPASQQGKIFEIFTQGSRDDSGTGIGLAITKRVIERHGGDIWVESDSGKGASFHFTLPKADTRTKSMVDN